MIAATWMDAHPLCWDQHMLDEALAGRLWRFGYDLNDADADGGVIVCPARYHSVDDVQKIIDPLEWVLLVLTSDEESTFPVGHVMHPNIRIWVQTPRRHFGGFRFFPHGAPPDTREILADCPDERTLDWMYAGQVNHPRRQQLVRSLRKIGGGQLHESPGFTRGLDRGDYLRLTAQAKIIPCPSGPATPDSFRTWEALEAGCVPLVDAVCPAYDVPDYWALLFGEHPLPVVRDWSQVRKHIAEQLNAWPRNTIRMAAWWMAEKRRFVKDLERDLRELGQKRNRASTTVLMPTSPIPSHPSTAMIEETVESIHANLGDVEIIIMCDGVRPEQADREADYAEYLRRLTVLCQRRWRNVLPIVFDTFQHQANMTRFALDLVDTPTVLFVEHDTPLVADEPTDWAGCFRSLNANELDVIRFHYEATIPAPHRHLMRDTVPMKGQIPYLRTTQWSQRPHLARTDYYRKIVDEFFPRSGRTMIEDRMHGVCQSQPWVRNRIGIYAPGKNLKRSLNLDGRGDDPKYEMRFS